MKLIKCSIDNFGSLSGVELRFKDGLTVINQPNGYGKTTLAEFIRAMFYGFPRQSKNLEKNLRKKYMPWQGGKYGGHLLFEYNGGLYWIDRYFGKTPAGDSFLLRDARTQKESAAFSENIGQELFGLDGDSFERSTYMPQLMGSGPLMTTGLQAKLGDLVEDTNDINNFDKAVKVLKKKRSGYIPYAGNGGSVAEAEKNISALTFELDHADADYQELAEEQEALDEQRRQKEIKDAALERVRQEIREASMAAARQADARRYGELLERQSQNREDLEELEARYARGFPTQEELDKIEPLYDKVIGLDGRIVDTEADEKDRALLEEHREKFQSGLPDEAVLKAREDDATSYINKEAQRRNSALPEYEEKMLGALEEKFADGLPQEGFLTGCQQKAARFLRLQEDPEGALTQEERDRMEKLRTFFAPGVPAEEELTEHRRKLDRMGALRAENVRLAARQVEAVHRTEENGRKKTPVPVLLVLGLAALAVGVFLLAGQSYAPGGICLGAGALFLLAAVYLKLKQDISAGQSGTAALSEEDRSQIRANRQETETLEGELLTFLSRYLEDGRSPEEKLNDIQTRRTEFLGLKQRDESFRNAQEENRRQAARLERELTDELEPYTPEGTTFEEQIAFLRGEIAECIRLRKKQKEQGEAVEKLTGELADLRRDIADFLRPYCGGVEPEQFSTALAELRRDSGDYESAGKRVRQREEQIEKRDEDLKKCADTLRTFGERYGLALDMRDRASFGDLCDDVEDHDDLLEQVKQDKEDVEAFLRDHGPVEDVPPAGEEKDLTGLNEAEAQLLERTKEMGRAILEQGQRVKLLRQAAELIPGKQDELERWKERKKADQARADLADKTIDFLTRAREELSDSYLDKITRSFAGYMDRLSGECAENIVVDSDLDVRVERLGQPRETGYFSVGQTDMITICMRMALVDALFENTAPFLILDDPFVNLDDAHTEQALAMLKELEKDHQIIYLVCNSSRMP